jgi:RNA-binding protein YhbY
MHSIKKIQIGKNGLTPEFMGQLKKTFEKSDSVKISLLKSACRDTKEAEEIGQKIVDALGKNFVFRRVGYVISVNKFRRNVR